MPREIYIDALKGLAILLVILAHALQRSFPDIQGNIYFNSIAAFHMPLFMFLSGYILYLNKAKYDLKWIWRKFLRLIVPFFTWTIIFYYCINFSFTGLCSFVDYSGSLLDSILRTVMHPGNGLWFLWVLFIFYLIAAGMSRSRKPCLFGLFILSTLAALAIIGFDLFGMYYIRFHIIFFVAGYAFSMFRDDKKIFLKSKLNSFGRKYYLALLPINWPIALYHMDLAIGLISKFILGFAGISLTWLSMSLVLPRIPKIQQLLSRIGGLTLEIYASHLLFLNTGFGIGYVKVISTSIIALLASLILIYSIKNVNILNIIFFGTRTR